MPLCPFNEMLQDAAAGGYAVGYFEPWDQYSMEAVVQAAQNQNCPVIIGCGGVMMNQEWFDHHGLAALAALGRTIAERASVPTSLLLNEVNTFVQIERGLDAGFNAVMLVSSHLPYEENLAWTKKVVDSAHAVGVAVEGELGHLPEGADQLTERDSLTDPDQAADFVSRTGIDTLAVSIGNAHCLREGQVGAVDFDRLADIHSKVSLPLVVHGGTGFPDEAVPQVIAQGVAKFNVGTIMKRLFHAGFRDALANTAADADAQQVIGSRKAPDLVAMAMDRVRQEVERRMVLYRNK